MGKVQKISITLTLVLLTAFLMIVPMTSVSAVNYFDGAKMIKTNGYKYYRAWSQDQFLGIIQNLVMLGKLTG